MSRVKESEAGWKGRWGQLHSSNGCQAEPVAYSARPPLDFWSRVLPLSAANTYIKAWLEVGLFVPVLFKKEECC